VFENFAAGFMIHIFFKSNVYMRFFPNLFGNGAFPNGAFPNGAFPNGAFPNGRFECSCLWAMRENVDLSINIRPISQI